MVGELKPGKLRCFHALTGKQVKYCLPVLDLTLFKLTELVEGYSLEHNRRVHRVFLSSNSNPLEAMVLYKGSLAKITVQEMNGDEEEEEKDEYCVQWKRFKVRKGNKFSFLYLDDVVLFKGIVCGVNRKGKLYTLHRKKMAVRSILVNSPVNWGNRMTGRRKRLVVDQNTNKLHLVVREHVQKKARFKVNMLNEARKRWIMVDSLGNDRVLFVGRTHCFFANVEYFPGCHGIGNCIVFVANCFTQYCDSDFPDRLLFDDDEDIGVYRYGQQDNFYTISRFPVFSQMLWPCPPWFPVTIEREWDDDNEEEDLTTSLNEKNSELKRPMFTNLPDNHKEGFLSESSDEDDDGSEEMHSDSDTSAMKTSTCSDEDDESAQQQLDSGKLAGKTSSDDKDDEEMSNSDSSEKQSNASEDEGEAAATKSVSVEPTVRIERCPSLETTFDDNVIRTSKMDNQVHNKVFSGTEPDLSKEGVPVCPLVNPCIIEMPSAETCISMVKFQGVDVKSYLVPTLETIWPRHGNLIGDDAVRNRSLLSCAMESLAKMVISLQNSTARTMTDVRAEELRSNVADLQRLGLKVDSLVPIIDKLAALQKNKAVIESIVALEKVKIEIEEMERTFLAETAKKKKELEESKPYLSATIPFPEQNRPG